MTNVFKGQRVGNGPTATTFNTAMVFVDCLVKRVRHIGKVAFLRSDEPLHHVLIQLPLVPLRASTSSDFWSMMVWAISFWQPMASILTMQPDTYSTCSSSGIAVI